MELIEALEAFSEPVEVLIKNRPLTSDPDDDMVMDVAINGVAEALVTGNTSTSPVPVSDLALRCFLPRNYSSR